MLSIREYVHQLDWDNICKIHDQARIIELEKSKAQGNAEKSYQDAF